MATKIELITSLIEPVVTGLDYELWGVELIGQGRSAVLRIYIDRETGVNVDDCAQVSRQVSSILDVEDPITENYVLEVSSPGLDRPLFNIKQFKQFIGHSVSIKLRIPFDGRRKFQGPLSAVEDDEIVVLVDDYEYVLPISSIDKANLSPSIHSPQSNRTAGTKVRRSHE